MLQDLCSLHVSDLMCMVSVSAVRVQVSADILDGSSSDSDSDENVSLEAELKLLKQQVSGGVSLSLPTVYLLHTPLHARASYAYDMPVTLQIKDEFYEDTEYEIQCKLLKKAQQFKRRASIVRAINPLAAILGPVQVPSPHLYWPTRLERPTVSRRSVRSPAQRWLARIVVPCRAVRRVLAWEVVCLSRIEPAPHQPAVIPSRS